MSAHHLAQLNVGRLVAPLDAAQGFVWRLQTEDGDATAVRLLDDERQHERLEGPRRAARFVYDSDHGAVMRRRREWFARMAEAYLAPAGTLPTVPDARDRLVHLRDHGPTLFAFTFRDWHEPD